MKITNFSDFDALKNRIANEQKDEITIRVAYATCGITAGAKPVVEALEKELLKHNLCCVSLKTTGCLGACYAEPTVMVTKDGVDTLFGYVDSVKAHEIVKEFVLNGKEIEGVIK
ncbi:(2Fe-2S) ferredoxin domain-containing protein [bacterium]|nr:(2Fe-2S) ferredoxin domain-containing protein [bacterium]